MEEYDDLSAGPAEDGKLDLSHNTWAVFPPELSSFSRTLLHLDIRNNRISHVPECVSSLTLLQSLDVSLNQIDCIDKGIEKCIRLRRLNISRNRLVTLPYQLCNCIMLEEIIANQNQLIELPETLVSLIAISMIDVRDNKLKSIPLGMCRVPTLKKILCEGNDLTIAPESMTKDRDLLFHCLEIQLKFKEVISAKSIQRDELQAKVDALREQLNNATKRIYESQKEIAALEISRPEVYLIWKRKFEELLGFLSDKVVLYWQVTKEALLKTWNSRKTHPMY